MVRISEKFAALIEKQLFLMRSDDDGALLGVLAFQVEEEDKEEA